METMSKRAKIGDIVEIRLPNSGIGYAQYTHKHKVYGSLIRVFRQKKRVLELSNLNSAEHLFTTFFPLGAAIKQGVVSLVGNLPVREDFKEFPIFKAGIQNPQGKVEVWWLWKNDNEERVGKLTAEQSKYPLRGVINDVLLVERICSDWQG